MQCKVYMLSELNATIQEKNKFSIINKCFYQISLNEKNSIQL